MSGYMKNICDKERTEAQKNINGFIYSLIPILPYNYDNKRIKQLLEKYYPYELFFIHEKYSYYLAKEKSLLQRKKKSRYHYNDVNFYINHSHSLKKILDIGFIKEHKKKFNQEIYKKEIQRFEIFRDPKIERTYKKIQNSIEKTQQLEPTYLDSLIGLYQKKSTSQKDKLYILKELEKYYCSKVTNFFSKLVDTEYNRQLREEACYFLQSLGYQPKLPRQKYIPIPNNKNKKKKEYYKKYAKETSTIKETPAELEYRIDNSKEQKMKEYDFFISHSSKDYESIQRLIKFLNKEGADVYCDWINDTDYLKRHLIGNHTLSVIKKRMDQSKKMIYVLSENSIKSKWCEYEVNYFNSNKKKILFIYKKDISETTFKYSTYNLSSFLKTNFEDSEKELFEKPKPY